MDSKTLKFICQSLLMGCTVSCSFVVFVLLSFWMIQLFCQYRCQYQLLISDWCTPRHYVAVASWSRFNIAMPLAFATCTNSLNGCECLLPNILPLYVTKLLFSGEDSVVHPPTYQAWVYPSMHLVKRAEIPWNEKKNQSLSISIILGSSIKHQVLFEWECVFPFSRRVTSPITGC